MAKSRFVQNNFVSGELSPLLRGRTDINQYYQGARTAKNVVIVPQGGMRRRPGGQFIDIVPEKLSRLTGGTMSMPNGGTPGNIDDGNDATNTATTVGISTTNPYVVAQYDQGLSLAVEQFIDVRGISLSSGSSSEFKVQYSTDGVAWTDAFDVPLIGTASQNYRYDTSAIGGKRYWRLS